MKKLALCICALILNCYPLRTITADSVTYSVIDNSAYGLGIVSLNEATASIPLSVPAPGSYTTAVASTVLSITIAGQTITAPSSGPLILASGAKAQVIWGSNYTEIIDLESE